MVAESYSNIWHAWGDNAWTSAPRAWAVEVRLACVWLPALAASFYAGWLSRSQTNGIFLPFMALRPSIVPLKSRYLQQQHTAVKHARLRPRAGGIT